MHVLHERPHRRTRTECPGVIAFAPTLYQCEQELKSSLEGRLIVKIRYGDKLPVMDKINLNNQEYSVHQVKILLKETEMATVDVPDPAWA